jgi:hypothetical protein
MGTDWPVMATSVYLSKQTKLQRLVVRARSSPWTERLCFSLAPRENQGASRSWGPPRPQLRAILRHDCSSFQANRAVTDCQLLDQSCALRDEGAFHESFASQRVSPLPEELPIGVGSVRQFRLHDGLSDLIGPTASGRRKLRKPDAKQATAEISGCSTLRRLSPDSIAPCQIIAARVLQPPSLGRPEFWHR